MLLSFIWLTVCAYWVLRRLSLRYPHPLLNVVVLSSVLVALVLIVLDVPYSDYAPARDIMTFLLGPATVGLAVPLYRHRGLLKIYALPIVASVALGAFTAMALAGGIARLGGMPREVVMSILPKGVSIPFAVEIARLYDGIPPLAAAFVVATGTLGSLMGALFLTRMKIKNPVARGLALGTVSHAQGTAAALLEGEEQGSMAGLAMILAGVFTALFAPVAVLLLNE
ncbi:MAG: LrgB family protein [Desulfovibrio sp.]|nr:LrgB family protein [Desulfovibrio sp.]MBI4960866.1 LrgB family protein [Desulfovibrio sp.]